MLNLPCIFVPKQDASFLRGQLLPIFFKLLHETRWFFLFYFLTFDCLKKRGNCFQKYIFLYVFISKQSVFVSCCFEHYPHVSLTRSSHLGFPSFSVLLVYTVIFVKSFYIKEWLHFKCTCTYIIRSFGSLHKALNV